MDLDKKVFSLIESERNRQINGIELIASENFASKAVREVLGSCLTNKYSEGTVGRRYYGGNEFIAVSYTHLTLPTILLV